MNMSEVISELYPSDSEVATFNAWFGEFMEDTVKLPGCDWRNILRDVRGELFRAFLIRYRKSEVMQFQKKSEAK